MLLNVKGHGYYCPFPVGGIYISASNASPSSLWPGTTWSRIAAGTFLAASGGSTSGDYAVGKTGGAASVVLSVDQIPNHQHPILNGYDSGGGTKQCLYFINGTNVFWSNTFSGDVGGGQSHENRPLSYAVSMWRRTA